MSREKGKVHMSHVRRSRYPGPMSGGRYLGPMSRGGSNPGPMYGGWGQVAKSYVGGGSDPGFMPGGGGWYPGAMSGGGRRYPGTIYLPTPL